MISRGLVSFFVLRRNNHRADALSLRPTRSRTRVGSERAPTPTRGALWISAMAPRAYKPPRSKILGQGCYVGFNLTGMSVPAEAISANPLGLFALNSAPAFDPPGQLGEGLYRLLRCAALTWGSRLRASSTSAGERPSMIR